MRLYLVQHGDALPADVDPARPLSTAGRGEVERVAAFMEAAGERVEQVWHSGKLRAEQTAEVLAATVAPGVPPEARAGLDPNDPVEPLAAEAVKWTRATMLVGHLPFMARLADRLVTGQEDTGLVAFRPGSVLCLERSDEDHWTIVWMIRPELLPG